MSTIIESDWENNRLKEEIESLRQQLTHMTEIARKEYLSAIDWAGKHQIQAEQLAEYKAEIFRRVTFDEMTQQLEETEKSLATYYETQLAASQAREQQLLEACLYGLDNLRDDCDTHIFEKAIALPQDTSSLEALISKAGEVMRERCIEVVDCEAIRALPPITLKDLE